MWHLLLRSHDCVERERRVSFLGGVLGCVMSLICYRMIGVGFSGSKASLEKLPGWEPESWAYHGDDGKAFGCERPGKSYGPKFTTGDVIGCGVNFKAGSAFFTKNGVFQGRWVPYAGIHN